MPLCRDLHINIPVAEWQLRSSSWFALIDSKKLVGWYVVSKLFVRIESIKCYAARNLLLLSDTQDILFVFNFYRCLSVKCRL